MRGIIGSLLVLTLGFAALGWWLSGGDEPPTPTTDAVQGPQLVESAKAPKRLPPMGGGVASVPASVAEAPKAPVAVASVPDALAPDAAPTSAPASAAALAPDAAPASTPAVVPDAAPSTDAPMQYSVDRDGIKTAVSDSTPQIAECYDAWLATGAEIKGKVVVRFTIAPNQDDPQAAAEITEAALVDSELDHPFMEGCVLDVMRGLKFDPPENGKVTVNYPFNLKREAEE
jgi:hypothetical protein